MNKISEKLGRVYLGSAVAATTMLMPIMSHAEGEIVIPTIGFESSNFAANMAVAIAFAVTAGLAFIGLAALTSVLRKSRGAVR